MMRKKLLCLFFAMLGVYMFTFKTEAKYVFDVNAQCEVSPKATIRIKVDNCSFDGFDIYREDNIGNFQFVNYIGIKRNENYNETKVWEAPEFDYSKNIYMSNWTLEKKKYVEYRTYVFDDESVLEVNHIYKYRVDGYRYEDKEKKIVDSKTVEVMILSAGTSITYGKRYGKLGTRIKWSKCDDADGYRIYMLKNYDEKSRFQQIDINDLSQYQLIKEVKAGTFTADFKNLMNGVTYTYRVCAFKNVNGEKIESTFSTEKAVLMNYYSCDYDDYAKRIKRAFGSQKKKIKNFSSSSKASKQMKTIKIKVWDYKKGKKGKKVTRTKYITVNKKLAPSIQQMFKEIYNSKEKQVIKDIGCYSYRQGEHMYGMAIDINPNENYMIDNGSILSGRYWKPNKDPYSIPADCEMVRIMKRYGFYRGEWGNRKDYMHFSYFGT